MTRGLNPVAVLTLRRGKWQQTRGGERLISLRGPFKETRPLTRLSVVFVLSSGSI